MALDDVLKQLARAGAQTVYGKALAPNDNSKNQVYLGGSLAAVNLLPVREIIADAESPKRLKAPVSFSWLTPTGLDPAPHAQLILYPDYPEVRLSGFLRGCTRAPNTVMASREPGRVLLIGVTAERTIVAIALESEAAAAVEFIAKAATFKTWGVLAELPLPTSISLYDASPLLRKLHGIHTKGWIRSWSLGPFGERNPCESVQCGGYTLEAELGIAKNARSEPDFLGWEIKSFKVKSTEAALLKGNAITLMTPEPTGALYYDDFAQFWSRYSYPDKSKKEGREGRRNFGGIYKCGARPNATTDLTLTLGDYNAAKQTFNAGGALSLVDSSGRVAASWGFAGLLEKWSRKHALAAFVPVEEHRDQPRRYRYDARVALARGTDFTRFLQAVSKGKVYLDPAVKFEDGKYKKRNQFRVAFKDLASLYYDFREERVIDP